MRVGSRDVTEPRVRPNSSGIRIEPCPLDGGALVHRYLDEDGALLDHFVASPFRSVSFREQAARLSARFDRSARERAAGALRPTSRAAAERLSRFVTHGGAVVTTGQQAGLFTGPLYTIHKALTAVRLAERLEQELGMVVLPVFWIASEDHDWAEANHTWLAGTTGRIRRVAIDPADRSPIPVHERVVGEDIENTFAALADITAEQRHTDDVLTWVREAYPVGGSVVDGFRSLVERLLAPWDVLTVDAADAMLKRASVGVLGRELDGAAEHEAVLATTSAALAELGLPAQVPIVAGAPNLFVRTEHGRERLHRAGPGWLTRESGTRFTTDELELMLREEPGRVSPNALLRPVVESAAFPVLAYVGGPGEIAYFAQIRDLFASHGVGMPIVYPRASFRLVEPEVQAAMERAGVGLDDLATDADQLLARHARRRMPRDVADALSALRVSLVERFDALAESAAGVDQSLRAMVGARRNRALLGVEDAERRIVRAIGRREGEWLSDVRLAQDHLAPLRTGQDRVLNVLPFIARHGHGLLRDVHDALDLGIRADTPARAASE
jgi:bacillithiol synthase